jgi:hypothetical protein
MRRGIALTIALLMISFASTGCIGRMAVVGQVMKFNLSVTENRWGRALVYLLLYVIPVYEIAGMIDLLIVNSIEFHTGTNPLSGEDRLAMNGGRHVIEAPDGARGVSTLREDGSIEIEITEANGTVHTVSLVEVDGSFEVRDPAGNYLGHVDQLGRIHTANGLISVPRS